MKSLTRGPFSGVKIGWDHHDGSVSQIFAAYFKRRNGSKTLY